MILEWKKPPKKMSVEDWKSISADGAPPGVYVPNMPEEWKGKWKAKKVGGNDPRVEIRKTFDGIGAKGGGYQGRDENHHAQVLIVVRDTGMVMSANSKMAMDFDDYNQLQQAIIEAKWALGLLPTPHNTQQFGRDILNLMKAWLSYYQLDAKAKPLDFMGGEFKGLSVTDMVDEVENCTELGVKFIENFTRIYFSYSYDDPK